MSIESIKGEFHIRGISDEATRVAFEHVKKYGKGIFIKFIKANGQSYSFSYEEKTRCEFEMVETAKEAIVFIPGADGHSTIVVTKKVAAEPKQEQPKQEAPKEAPKTAAQSKSTQDDELATKIGKAVLYAAGALAVGVGGYFAWKRWDSN